MGRTRALDTDKGKQPASSSRQNAKRTKAPARRAAGVYNMAPTRRQPRRGSSSHSCPQSVPVLEPEDANPECVRFDGHRFKDVDCYKWYEERRHRKIVCEKGLSQEIDDKFNILSYFDFFGWSPILEINGEYYEDIIREFYANLRGKRLVTSTSLNSYLRGKSVSITYVDVARVLGLDPDGVCFDMSTICDMEMETGFDLTKALSDLHLEARVSREDGRLAYRTADLQLVPRLLVYLIGYNILPRAGSLSEMRQADIYLLHRMITKPENVPKFSLARTIIYCIQEVTTQKNKALIFPLVIHKCLEQKGFDFSCMGRVLPEKQMDLISFTTLTNMGYRCVDGEWRKKREQGESSRTSATAAGGRGGTTSGVSQCTHEGNAMAQLLEQQRVMMERQAKQDEEIRRMREILERQAKQDEEIRRMREILERMGGAH